MPGARRFADFEPADQERQRQTRQHDQTEQVKTIHEREHRGLLRHYASDHSVRLMDRVGGARAARYKEVARVPHELPHTWVG